MKPGKILDAIAGDIRICRQCPLWEGACRAVPGEGNPEAEVVFVGEAPGRIEDLSGRPFVGKSGTLLDTLFYGTGIERQSVFIGNLVKHRPPGNRAPSQEEIRACTPFLKRQIDAIQPSVIVTLGRVPAAFLLSLIPVVFTSLSDVRGRSYPLEWESRTIRVIPTYHPASALRNPHHLKLMEEDFRMIERAINSPDFS
jgi:uracil-DNA glycosylase